MVGYHIIVFFQSAQVLENTGNRYCDYKYIYNCYSLNYYLSSERFYQSQNNDVHFTHTRTHNIMQYNNIAAATNRMRICTHTVQLRTTIDGKRFAKISLRYERLRAIINFGWKLSPPCIVSCNCYDNDLLLTHTRKVIDI